MDTPYVIEIEPEVRLWLMNLPYNDFLVVEHVAELLREIVLLTVFRKTRRRETAEVARAKRAKVLCQTEHPPAHDVYTRTADEEKEKR
ncbi:hypothetical protein [Streptomyces sp. NPDC058011]|uniref:hypothetical protein n=1 Tax=Streptomyces sp. NPDC058011 TaxID=3346305 RepID=UPI0036E84D0D